MRASQYQEQADKISTAAKKKPGMYFNAESDGM